MAQEPWYSLGHHFGPNFSTTRLHDGMTFVLATCMVPSGRILLKWPSDVSSSATTSVQTCLTRGFRSTWITNVAVSWSFLHSLVYLFFFYFKARSDQSQHKRGAAYTSVCWYLTTHKTLWYQQAHVPAFRLPEAQSEIDRLTHWMSGSSVIQNFKLAVSWLPWC